MPNKQYAIEWFDLGRKNLEAAIILNNANHYTDIIAIELHQSLEKIFKSILAYNAVRIPKTHDLLLLLSACSNYKIIDDNSFVDDLMILNDYYSIERYPGPKYSVPTSEEINKGIQIAQQLMGIVGDYLK